MDVDGAVRRRVDERDGQDLTVGGDDQAVRVPARAGFATTSGAPILAGVRTSRPSSRAASPTGRGAGRPLLPRPVRPRDHGHDLVTAAHARSDGTANDAVPQKTSLTQR